MSRIASLAANNQLINILLQTQRNVNRSEIQLSTQKLSQDYKGISRQAERLVNIENSTNLLERFIDNNNLQDLRLKVGEIVTEDLRKTLGDLRTLLDDFDTGSITAENAKTVQDAAFRALLDVQTTLNTDVDGRFLYSGGRVDTAPVKLGLTNLADFQAKWTGDAATGTTFPTTRDTHINLKLTASTGFPTTPTTAGYTSITFPTTSTMTAATTGAFANIPVGAKITLTGAEQAGNNSTFTVSANNGTTITISPAGFTVDVTADLGITLVADTSYYQGDEVAQTHRVSKERSFSVDLNAVEPTFEKALRAIGIVAQGVFGTTGGLDANPARVSQARDLLNLALGVPGATGPFGAEQTGNITDIQRDIGFQRILINQTNEIHTDLIGFFEQRIIESENATELETITRLLDDSRALEASFQALARVQEISLTNFL